MSRLRFRISVSLDGFAAVPDQSPKTPLGGGGERLFDNVRDLHGLVLVETVSTPNIVHLRFVRQ